MPSATGVTPYVGVWIETLSYRQRLQRNLSLLMWECGLKHPTVYAFWFQKTVTPYVGVWIETLVRPTRMSSWKSLLMWECGLKQGRRHIAGWLQGHSLCGSVDWNIETTAGFEAAVSHSLCGSVDWNRSNGQRVWESPWSLLMWECGLKQPCTS